MKSTISNRNIFVLLTVIALSTTLALANSGNAFAHMNFKFIPGNGAIAGSGSSCSSGTCTAPAGNHTVSFVLGETFEPGFTDEYHDLELSLTHDLTQFGLGSAHKDQTKAAFSGSDFSIAGKVLLAETYFYPASHLVNSAGNLVGGAANSPTSAGVKPSATANTDANSVGFSCDANSQSAYTGAITSGVLLGNAFNCKPNAGGVYGYTDSRTGMFMRPLGASEGMSKDGQYRQSTRQFYTEQGLTLYHVYGAINYFNDTGIGLTKINLWTDGKNIKVLSMAAAGGTGNRTYTISSGFGLSNRTTSIYWPDADGGVTENTHPTNMRKAIGTIRDNSWDTWNLLEQLTNALRGVTGFVQNAIPDHTPRNYTNPGPTSNGQYSFP